MATKKVYFNTIAQLAAKFSTAFISIFLIKILTNYLSVDEYWLYSKVYNYLSIFAVIADMWLFTITIREISTNKDNKELVQKIIWNMMTVRLSLWILIIFLSVAIAYFLPWYNSKLALWSIFITSFFVFFWLMNSAIISLLQAYLKTEFSFVSTTVGKFSNFLFILLVIFVLFPKSIITANPDLKFWAFLFLMFAGVFGNIIMTVMIYWHARNIEKISFHFDKKYIKELIKVSIPYWIAMFLNVIYFKVDIIILSLMEPRNIVDTSIWLYSVPMKIVEVGMLFWALFLQSMLPLFSQAIKNKDSFELWVLVRKAYKLLFAFGIWIVGFSLINWYELLSLVASKDYLDSTKHIYTSLDSYRITVFVFLFCFISSIFTYLLIANNDQWKLLKLNFYLTLINIILNIILIPYLSFYGSSIATLISEIVMLTNTYYASRHIFKFNFMPKYSAYIILIWLSASLLNYYSRTFFNFWNTLTLIISFTVFCTIFIPGFYYWFKKLY